MTKSDKLIEKEGDLYIPGGFRILFSRFCFLFQCLNKWVFYLFQILGRFPLYLHFSQNEVF